MRVKRYLSLVSFFLLGQLLLSNHASAQSQELLGWQLFTDLQADLRSDLDPNSNQDASDTSASASVLYNQAYSHMKILGEAVAANDTGDLKRLQLGWAMSENHTLWLGKFFNPIGYWNVHYHHGSYLSPAIHRPSIVSYEDNGGILPLHVSGVLLAGHVPLVGHTLSYRFAAGEGPELNSEGQLKPLDLLHPAATEHDRSLTAQLSLSDAGVAPMESGLFVSHTLIPSKLGSVTKVDQKIYGAFFHANWQPLETLWTFYTITNTVTQAGNDLQGSFSGGYARVAYNINSVWTAYMSFEDIQHSSSDPYLLLFPDFVIARDLAGLRLNFRKDQALTFELLDSKLQQGSHIHTSVQWSALFD